MVKFVRKRGILLFWLHEAKRLEKQADLRAKYNVTVHVYVCDLSVHEEVQGLLSGLLRKDLCFATCQQCRVGDMRAIVKKSILA